jgi:hypothetical protein
MVNIYSEKSIGNAVIKELNRKNKWVRVPSKGRGGVDIELKNKGWGNKHWFIEVKREPTSQKKKFNKKSRIYTHVATGIGQLIYRMKTTQSSYYGLAVPETLMFKKELNKIPLLIKKRLNIIIFLVSKHGKITRITPAKKVRLT